MIDQQNHAAGGANGSIMVGMFVCLCLASKKPSEGEFFVPAGTDLGVKLLRKNGNPKNWVREPVDHTGFYRLMSMGH